MDKLAKSKIEGIRKQAHKNLRLIMKNMHFRGSDYGYAIVGCCPVKHTESKTPNDNNKAFSWDFNRQIWQCFSHRCHSIYGADIFGLVRSVFNLSFAESIEWILKVIGQTVDGIEDLTPKEADEIANFLKKKSELYRHKKIEDEILKHLTPSKYFINRGISSEAIKEFKCFGEWHKYKTYGDRRAIVPVYDSIDGFLVGFTGRALKDSDIGEYHPKWSHFLNFADMIKKNSEKTDEDRFHVGSILYNLHRAKYHMGSKDTIIIVEGPLDVMKLWDFGIKNVVGILGTGFSEKHRTLLHKVGCQRVISFLDGDGPGQKAAKGIQKICENYFEFHIVTIPEDKDPGELNEEEVKVLLKEFIDG